MEKSMHLHEAVTLHLLFAMNPLHSDAALDGISQVKHHIQVYLITKSVTCFIINNTIICSKSIIVNGPIIYSDWNPEISPNEVFYLS